MRRFVICATAGVLAAVVVGLGLFLAKPKSVVESRSEFVQSVIGKTQNEVISTRGRPDSVSEGFPGDEGFIYRDPEGSSSRLVVVFTNGKAVAVRLEG